MGEEQATGRRGDRPQGAGPLKGRSAPGSRRLRPSHPCRPQRARPLSRGPPPGGARSTARLLDFHLSRPQGPGTVVPGWSLGALACWMCILTCDQAGAQAQPRVAMHRFVGYQALESISRGFYRPSSSEIRLIRLSVYQALESATPWLFTGTTATEALEEDLGDQHCAARFPGAASEAVPRRVRGARKLALSWAWLRRSPNVLQARELKVEQSSSRARIQHPAASPGGAAPEGTGGCNTEMRRHREERRRQRPSIGKWRYGGGGVHG